jgi:hypothetical protein
MTADGRDGQPIIPRLLAVLRYYLSRAATLPGRALDWSVAHFPLSLRERTLLALNRTGRPTIFNLDGVNPLERQHLIDRRVLTEGTSIEFVADAPIHARVGHFWPALRLHRLRDTVVEPRSGLVFASGRLIAESGDGRRDPEDIALLASALQRSRLPHESIPGSLVPVNGMAFTYYHFLIEVLPRVLAAREADSAVRALLGPTPAKHALDAFDALSIPYVVTDAPGARADITYVCDPDDFGWPHPHHISALRRIAPRQPVTPPTGDLDRIYVSRAGSSRAMAEEEALEDWLGSHGFAAVRFESVPWSEQVAMMRGASVVIAPHGAGLSNCVFMPPGSRVVELTSGLWWHPCFRNLAHLAGLDHHLLQLPYRADRPQGDAADAIELLRAAGVDRSQM